MERKFEEAIEKYYEKRYGEEYHVFMVCNWSELPFSMQWGVLVDFFEEKGIGISIIGKYNYTVSYLKSRYVGEIYSTRQKARKAALEKAKQLLNNQSK